MVYPALGMPFCLFFVSNDCCSDSNGQDYSFIRRTEK